ncbi:LysE/ArgO family amino acid transporter [Halodesulfovibrio sp.]|uniref:LysE/ArgO family amino acid transporter n=1 Tax=Halodesulfovibrio sp. TaxID=1912772 RepID=UPI0025BAB88D|nr:LysE/ArgO family amino acid transporter [Halodesulfovibrio sp.]
MLAPFFQGFGTCGGLIMAIGAQNAFLLSQSVRKNHHLTIALMCIMADMLLIGLGVFSVGRIVASSPEIKVFATFFGAAFLLWYGFCAFRSACKPGVLTTSSDATRSLRSVVLTTLAVTFLNPHTYLDTVVLMGSLGGQFIGNGKIYFWIGGVCASAIWFGALAFGGQALAPLFRKPSSWRILDGTVCAVMWLIAAGLIKQGIALL